MKQLKLFKNLQKYTGKYRPVEKIKKACEKCKLVQLLLCFEVKKRKSYKKNMIEIKKVVINKATSKNFKAIEVIALITWAIANKIVMMCKMR